MKKAYQIVVRGIVQGVGFRPYVFNLAKIYNLTGWVKNTQKGVEIRIEGEEEQLKKFIDLLPQRAPSHAKIFSLFIEEVPLSHFEHFVILKGERANQVEFDLLPDLGICEDCLRELVDPTDRRFEYPFITCTLCGPRFSVIESLPYERENTTMKYFPLCERCREEYENPENRRFHAETTACPLCGPKIELYNAQGILVAEDREALFKAQKAIEEGKILALKGLTGFHLIARADDSLVIEILRNRKLRKKKPFAVMVKNLSEAEKYVFLSEKDKELLAAPMAPILILPSKGNLPYNLNEGLKELGIFLPYTPLHYLLLKDLPFPIICTSGNLSEEPLLFENDEAFEKLSKIADLFLVHDRPIKRPLDDSVIKKAGSFYIMVRRGRGYTPLPLHLSFEVSKPILAVGAHEKNTISLAYQNKIIVSQHIGDLDNEEVLARFKKTIEDFLELYNINPLIIVADYHPFYASTKWAKQWGNERGIPVVFVQHHIAHLYSVLAEEGINEGEFLGIAWDGTGYGLDHTIWGGEFFYLNGTQYNRVYTFRPFKLLGGERAIKDIRRTALSILLEIFGEEALNLPLPFLKTFEEKEILLLFKAWKEGINSPLSSSVGRLFDAVSALLALCYNNTYSGEAAMRLESLYSWDIKENFEFEVLDNFYIDWEPMFKGILEDLKKRKEPNIIATKFINTLARVVQDIAVRVGLNSICLSGGVMMNSPLVQRLEELLTKKGFSVYKNKNFPPNDGGLSLGQAYFTALSLRE
ncbi:MAG: carbamoyltransferase HypF [Caldimicrobium sp.]